MYGPMYGPTDQMNGCPWFEGVRVDSAHSLPPEFTRRVTGRIRNKFPDRFIVGEYSPEGAQALHDFDFDAVWLLSTCDNAASMSNSWKGDIGTLESLVCLRPGYDLNSQCIKFLMGSHDQCGKRPGRGSRLCFTQHVFAAQL